MKDRPRARLSPSGVRPVATRPSEPMTCADEGEAGESGVFLNTDSPEEELMDLERPPIAISPAAVESRFLSRVYAWMASGLGITALVSWTCLLYTSDAADE